MIIWFNVKEAYDFLMENGEVYTLRAKPKKDGKHQLRSIHCPLEGFPYVVGKVNVRFVMSIIAMWRKTEEQLKPYVAKSGFKDVQECY